MSETARAASLRAHLVRGAVGFGSLLAALTLAPSVGPAALMLVVPGLVALRGCPMCWVAGLLEAVSAGRLERTCADGSCAVRVGVSEGAGATPATAAAPDGETEPDLPRAVLAKVTKHVGPPVHEDDGLLGWPVQIAARAGACD